MTLLSSFAREFREARVSFLKAAAAARGMVESHVNPALGPDGEELATDTAWFGPVDAESVLVVLSGTHGVEGFCGSGAQVEFLRRREFDHYPTGTAVLLIHAVNPFGFAWLRRVNEDNVDLNRNWIDFDAEPPKNQNYSLLRSSICPAVWTDDSCIASDPDLSAHAQRYGFESLQSAISSGQWEDPAGVFYGGNERTWSRRIQTMVFERHLKQRRRVAILDLHTGLGPVGFCERILTIPSDEPASRLARRWFGAGLTSPAGGTSTSAIILGDGLTYAVRMLEAAQVEVVAIALEYGTVLIDAMLDAVRADAWLHAHGDLESPKGKAIKTRLRNAFYIDDDVWRGMVIGQFLLTARQAAMAMSSDL